MLLELHRYTRIDLHLTWKFRYVNMNIHQPTYKSRRSAEQDFNKDKIDTSIRVEGEKK